MFYKSPILYLKLCLLAMACSSTGLVQGQIQAYNISFVSENIALPFTRLQQVHPGIEAGIILKSTEKSHSIRSFGLQLGGYSHSHFEKAFYLQGQYSHGFKLGKTLSIDLPLSLGYKHGFQKKGFYKIDPQTGDFTKAPGLGRAQVMLNAGIGISYRKHQRISPFIRHEFAIQGPFSVFFPLLPHTFTKAGITLNLSQRAQ